MSGRKFSRFPSCNCTLSNSKGFCSLCSKIMNKTLAASLVLFSCHSWVKESWPGLVSIECTVMDKAHIRLQPWNDQWWLFLSFFNRVADLNIGTGETMMWKIVTVLTLESLLFCKERLIIKCFLLLMFSLNKF